MGLEPIAKLPDLFGEFLRFQVAVFLLERLLERGRLAGIVGVRRDSGGIIAS